MTDSDLTQPEPKKIAGIDDVVMALEALKLLMTVAPYFVAAFQQLLKLLHPTDANQAATSLNAIVGYAEEALTQVAALKFDSNDPVANTLGAWNSAYATVSQRAALLGVTDPAAIQTAMDLASHKTQTDSPLDVLPTAGGTIVVPAAPDVATS